MIFYQSIKYFILDSCLTIFFDKLKLNLKINMPLMTIPVVGSCYKEIRGPRGEHFTYMVCKAIVKKTDLNFEIYKNNLEDELLYMFSIEGKSVNEHTVIIDLIINELELSNWILIP